METTRKTIKDSILFTTEIPSDINDALKQLAKEKTRKYKRYGTSFTKEGVIVAALEKIVDARKTGSIKTLASWLFDGEYTGNISEMSPGEDKISAFSSGVHYSRGGKEAIRVKRLNPRRLAGVASL